MDEDLETDGPSICTNPNSNLYSEKKRRSSFKKKNQDFLGTLKSNILDYKTPIDINSH